jgi:hypothetical protein
MYGRLIRIDSLTLTAACLSTCVVAAAGCHGTISNQDDPQGAGGRTGTGSVNGGGGQGAPGGAAGVGDPDAGAAGIGDPGAGGAGVVAPPSALPAESACTSNAQAPRMLRRLSAPQFDATIRSIFGDTTQSAPVAAVFSDPVVLGFSVDANALLVQGLNASQLMDNAEAVAAWAVANNKLSQFATCTTHDTTCGQKFIQGFGRRAFRTTLASTDARIAAYNNLFMAESSFSNGAQAVMAAMMQSPYFIYRTELGQAASAGGATFNLTPYEVASGLSYLLTGSMPDDTLLTAADSVQSGSLSMSSMVDQQAQRMLTASNPSSQTAIMGFMTGWLGLDRLYTTAKDDTVYAMTSAMRDNMAAETRNLILEAFNGQGSFGDLLTADHSFLNKDLAAFYGITASGLGTSFVSVPYAGQTRDPGLLAQGTILNGYARPDTSSPTQRGHLVRTRLLCQDVPPPPADLDTKFKPAMTALTTRQHFENEHSVGVCYTCHKYMDEIGFGFENYDGFGRYRSMENGVSIDATGTLFGVDSAGDSPTFDGLAGTGGLEAYLAQDDDVKRCMIRYWTYYSYGSSSWSQDACTYSSVYQAAASSGFALRSVLMGIIHAPSFTQRVQDQ